MQEKKTGTIGIKHFLTTFLGLCTQNPWKQEELSHAEAQVDLYAEDRYRLPKLVRATNYSPKS